MERFKLWRLSFFSPEIKNIFFELLIPNTKLIVVEIIYRAPSQTNFLEIMNTHFNKLDANNNEIRKYYEFCSMFGLKQLIEVPTRVICTSSTMIDHILASFPSRDSQQSAINVRLFDHQIIYSTRKISRIKKRTHKQIRRSLLENYSPDITKKSWVD